MKANFLNPNKRNKKSVFIALFIIYPLFSLKAETFTNTEGIQFNGEIQRVEQDGIVIQTEKELKKIKFKRLQQNLVFTNTEGIQYNGKIQRVEPDGIVLQTEGGIEKVKFKKLPQDIALKYGYNPSSESRFIEEQINQKNILNRQILQSISNREAKAILESKRSNSVVLLVKIIRVFPDKASVIAKDTSNEYVFYIQGLEEIAEGDVIQIKCYRDGNQTSPDGHVLQKWIVPGKEDLQERIINISNISEKEFFEWLKAGTWQREDNVTIKFDEKGYIYKRQNVADWKRVDGVFEKRKFVSNFDIVDFSQFKNGEIPWLSALYGGTPLIARLVK